MYRSDATVMMDLQAGNHDDVIKWKHFPRYWPFVRGIHRSPVNSPHKGRWRGALILSSICALNKQLYEQSWGWWFETPPRSLWWYCNEWIIYILPGNLNECFLDSGASIIINVNTNGLLGDVISIYSDISIYIPLIQKEAGGGVDTHGYGKWSISRRKMKIIYSYQHTICININLRVIKSKVLTL